MGITDAAPQPKRPLAEYLRYDPYEGDRDLHLRCRTTKLVKARTEHACWEGMNPDGVGPHTIKPGELHRFEQAICDGKWGSCRTCLPCIDRWLDEMHGDVP